MEKTFNELGSRLLKADLITEEQLNEALHIQKEVGGLLGEILVGKGFLSDDDLANYLYTNKFSKFGELLLAEKVITQDQLMKALEYQKMYGGRIGDVCVSLGFAAQEDINRTLENHQKPKMKLGDMLLGKGLITKEQLDTAMDLQRRSGGRLGEIIVYLDYLDEEILYRELANQAALGRIGENIDITNIKKLPFSMATKYSAMVLSEKQDSYVVAVRNRLENLAVAEIEFYLGKKVEQVYVTESEQRRYWEESYQSDQKHSSVFELYDDQPENSAIVTFTSNQIAVMIGMLGVLLICLVFDWRSTLFWICIFFQIIYALMTLGKLAIVVKGERNNNQLRYKRTRIQKINEADLPIYTILVPVFKEKEIVSKLIHNIGALDYPQYKLDVRILLEENDQETIDVINSMKLPSNYTPIIVPQSQPQTKPKACNYGLLQAKGEYVVIYDAEDRPEVDQLKKVYLAFRDLPDEYVCIQAKLNYFNSSHNALTTLFTQEYSMWFELLLVGIMQMDIPLPLGGTSNHFKMSFLKEVGGWDPFNVTEDADLGIRLYKFDYKTAILDSRTWEEANSKTGNWIRQRSRWIKGYMQTWLVHMRHPVTFYKTLGLRGLLGYQAMILGTPLLPLINPFFWLLMVLWILTEASWIASLFPGVFYYIATVQMILGNFVFTYMNIMGMYHVIRDCAMKRIQPFSFRLIKYALMTPLYWVLMSVAAYKALFQLFFKPFYWEKTDHGLSEEDTFLREQRKKAAKGKRKNEKI